jgi:DNA-binding CsgD family transcriptional regulator
MMTREQGLDAKNQRMLELLAQGSTSRVIAKQMGYQEGTMRVYLHNLYRRIGVANKTEAVVWYLNRDRARDDVKAVQSAQKPGTGDLLGDMALEEDLYAALGVMSHFVGPYSRVWEVGQRIAGAEDDGKLTERRARARLLWRALLRGDWAYGKRLHDADQGGALVLDSPSEAAMLVCLLLAGGYSLAADRLASRLTDKRKAGPGASARESALIRALRDALHSDDAHAFATLGKIATDKGNAALKQVALALTYHAYKARGDSARAREAANALWVEAENARKQLQAMGERPLGGGEPAPVRAPAKAREKAAAAR